MMASTTTLALFGPLGTTEVVLIVVAILLLFGGKKLPELARGLGRGLRLFKDEVEGVKEEIKGAVNIETKPQEPKSTKDACSTCQSAPPAEQDKQ
jgi:sec-independent protein translocase protein TatA